MIITKDFVTYKLTDSEISVLLKAQHILDEIENIRPNFPVFQDSVSGEILDVSHTANTIQSVLDCSGHSLKTLNKEAFE